MRRLAAGLVRLIAALVLIGALVVLPLAVWRGVGGPGAIDWRAAFGSGRIDADTVVALGLIVFTALWAWFAATAVGEVLHVVSWRSRADVVLTPIEPTPSGAIRRLVRIVLISTSAVVGVGLASITSMAVTGGPASARADMTSMSAGSSMSSGSAMSAGSAMRAITIDPLVQAAQVRGEPVDVRSNGRDTPYSIAVRLGDASLRDRIIALNHGEPMPEGGAWSGGVFPAGMAVRVPAGVQLPQEATWQPYTVIDGDSVYRIATRLAAGDNRRVRDLADAIIDRNAGRTMVDGKVFDDPSLVRIGWVLDVPDSAADAPGASGVRHLVAPGESYWSIAERHAGAPDDDPAALARLVDELQDINAARLGHGQREMLHPGDELQLPADVVADPVAPPAAASDDQMGPDVVVRPERPDPSAGAVPTVPAVPPAPEPDETAPATMPLVLTLPDTTTVAIGVPEPAPADVVGQTGPANQTIPANPTHAAGPAVVVSAGETRSPMTTSLAAAVLLCAGALGLVESRRRHQLRGAGPLAELPAPIDELVRTERLVRSLDATQRAVRLDIALRSAGHLLVGTGGFVRAVIVDDDATVTLMLDRPGRLPSAPWRMGHRTDRWMLDGETSNDIVAPTARLAGQPCPATIHLGRLALDDGVVASGDLFIDLEAFGLVCLDAGDGGEGEAERTSASIVRAIATSLATSPMAETVRLITHGLDPSVHLGNLNAEAAADLEHALDLAAAALGATPTAIGGLRTSELRARGVGGEAWEPVVVVSTAAELSADAARELLDLTRAGGRSLAVVLGHPIEGASLTVRAAPAGWELAPLGLTVVPVGVGIDHVRQLHRLLEAAAAPLPEVPRSPMRSSSPAGAGSAAPSEETPFEEAPWALMVRVLGAVEVVTATGDTVSFDRGKSLELVAWLGQHRGTANRGGARAALWELEVRDATFSNVVSDARRSLARAVAPAEGVDWIGRTMTGQLPLHAMVVTDAELLRARVEHARHLPSADAVHVLRPGVALIRDLPFAGTDYLWPAAEGVTSALTLLATAAAIDLARHHLALGDVDGVFWATGQGLLALPGHEELIGLRMRAHAQRGDLAGVRSEWEAYERAITADVWSDGEPSPKLLTLRRELLNR